MGGISWVQTSFWRSKDTVPGTAVLQKASKEEVASGVGLFLSYLHVMEELAVPKSTRLWHNIPPNVGKFQRRLDNRGSGSLTSATPKPLRVAKPGNTIKSLKLFKDMWRSVLKGDLSISHLNIQRLVQYTEAFPHEHEPQYSPTSAHWGCVRDDRKLLCRSNFEVHFRNWRKPFPR